MIKDLKIDDEIFNIYFEDIIGYLNKGIDDLNIISKYFEEKYTLEKFENELLKIFKEDECDEINLNELKKISGELIVKHINQLYQFNKFWDEIVGVLSFNNEKSKANKNKEIIVETLKVIIMKKMKEKKDIFDNECNLNDLYIRQKI